jgi:maleate isomerase
MTDVLGWRKVFAVIGPSTNTVVQPDMEAMRPSGVTNHYRSIYVENPMALSDADFMAGADKISMGMKAALRTAITCAPDYLVLGVSAISFIGGRTGCDAFVDQVTDLTGLQISVGSRATVAALQACSAMMGSIQRIAFLSPYYPVANAHVRSFFQEYGYEVKRDICLRCTSWTDIAQQPESRLVSAIRELDGDDVDAIVQVGTNLSMTRLAAQAEVWLGKPVIAINTATYWHALRANGIADKVDGFGSLLSKL